MGNCLSHFKCVTNIAGISSLILSFFPKILLKNAHVLRPLLNVSWGYLFGSTLWFTVFSEIGLLRGISRMKKIPSPENAEEAKKQLEEIQKNEPTFLKRNEDFSYFFSLSTLFSSILLLVTVKLAYGNLQLRISSTVVMLASLLNNLYLHKKLISIKVKKEELYNNLITNKKSETIIADIKKNKREFHIYHGLSIIALYLSFFGLTPYIFT
ncbi:conserved protein, unknown function [Hepatocystis sp. ex Piliocolobus tephrosceles]|nr:conserved protein, unknown function [Hepatocystis sp. ex Piliocolobus tephrosceles]